MVTWTTYGTWLQGDKRGYVKDGRILEGDQTLLELCKGLQKGQTVKLTKREKETVRRAILSESQRIGQNLEALAVCTNHLHLAARPCCKSIERIVSMYKSGHSRPAVCRQVRPNLDHWFRQTVLFYRGRLGQKN